jgi:hypothetical protein
MKILTNKIPILYKYIFYKSRRSYAGYSLDTIYFQIGNKNKIILDEIKVPILVSEINDLYWTILEEDRVCIKIEIGLKNENIKN